MSLNYAILLVSELESLSKEQTALLFSKVAETGIGTIRRSSDDTKAIVKWDSEENPCELLSLSHSIHNHSEILEIIQTSEWQEEIL